MRRFQSAFLVSFQLTLVRVMKARTTSIKQQTLLQGRESWKEEQKQAQWIWRRRERLMLHQNHRHREASTTMVVTALEEEKTEEPEDCEMISVVPPVVLAPTSTIGEWEGGLAWRIDQRYNQTATAYCRQYSSTPMHLQPDLVCNGTNALYLSPNGIAYKTPRNTELPGLNKMLLHEIYMNFVTLQPLFPVETRRSPNAMPTVVRSRQCLPFRDSFLLPGQIIEKKSEIKLVLGMDRAQGDLLTWMERQRNEVHNVKGSPPTTRVSPWKAFYGYLCDIFLALHYLHMLGITHCDVKPENIMIDLDGKRAYLSDFDAACFGPRRVPSINLTLAYMPPEETRGTAAQPRFRVPSFDAWSMAMVIQNCLVGDRLVLSDAPISRHAFYQACTRVYDMTMDQCQKLYMAYVGLHDHMPAKRMSITEACSVLGILPTHPAPRLCDYTALTPPPADMSFRKWYRTEQRARKHCTIVARDPDQWHSLLSQFVAIVERHRDLFEVHVACVALNLFIETRLSVVQPQTAVIALASLDLAARICNDIQLQSDRCWTTLLQSEHLATEPLVTVAHIRQMQHIIAARWQWGDVRRAETLTPETQWQQFVRTLRHGPVHNKRWLKNTDMILTYQPRRVTWQAVLCGWQNHHVETSILSNSFLYL